LAPGFSRGYIANYRLANSELNSYLSLAFGAKQTANAFNIQGGKLCTASALTSGRLVPAFYEHVLIVVVGSAKK